MNARTQFDHPERPPSRDPSKDSEDVRLLRALATTHYAFGRFDSSAKLIDLALWIAPSDRDLLELRAIVASRRGRHDQCLDFVNRLEQTGAALSPILLRLRLRCQTALRRQRLRDSTGQPGALR